MENKELENKASEALNDDALDTVSGGLNIDMHASAPAMASINVFADGGKPVSADALAAVVKAGIL